MSLNYLAFFPSSFLLCSYVELTFWSGTFDNTRQAASNELSLLQIKRQEIIHINMQIPHFMLCKQGSHSASYCILPSRREIIEDWDESSIF